MTWMYCRRPPPSGLKELREEIEKLLKLRDEAPEAQEFDAAKLDGGKDFAETARREVIERKHFGPDKVRSIFSGRLLAANAFTRCDADATVVC